MAFTGDLEHLPIVDIIQLVHTTRKSGVFSVAADKGTSSLVFSNGVIVGANHLDDSIRIGTVLVKTGAITLDDLKVALDATKNAAAEHTPLLVTLMQMGKLKREDALRGLKKLVELTIVELMSWKKGTFTFDTETSVFSPGAGAAFGDAEQDVGIDAQMVLMDALRVFDERERDREKGKAVPSFEELYADVLPEAGGGKPKGGHAAITADVLGLADLDKLEKKIPRPVADMELFDPVAIHRQKIKELLADCSPEDQEAFVSFLRRSGDRKAAPGAPQQADKAVVLYSADRLLQHAVMTLCNDVGVPVFATEDEPELERLVSQCLGAMRMPLVVFDSPAAAGGLPEEKIVALRGTVRATYPAVPLLQFAAPRESAFVLQSYDDGVRAVFPKPEKEEGRESFVADTIRFLHSFRSYVREFQYRPDTTERYLKKLKEDLQVLRDMTSPSDAALVILAAVADTFERAIMFLVQPSPAALIGESAIGVSAEKSMGPTQAGSHQVALAQPSIFREVLEKGEAFYGESSDEALKGLFRAIGAPRSPAVLLLPVKSERKIVAVVYGDFGQKEASPVQLDLLEILAQQVGIVLEYAVFRRQAARAAKKS